MNDVLVIGGGVTVPAGPYASTLELFETGLLNRFGIKDIAVAGHPDGSPDIPDALAIEAGTITSLATDYTPETFVMAIEEASVALARPTILQIHVFPFGGLQEALNWLRRRGSWSCVY